MMNNRSKRYSTRYHYVMHYLGITTRRTNLADEFVVDVYIEIWIDDSRSFFFRAKKPES